jgi:hypothetical protein
MSDPRQEPPNSTVEDWYGQSVERDRELAERLVQESDSLDEAEDRFEDEARGREEQESRRGDRLEGGAA